MGFALKKKAYTLGILGTNNLEDSPKLGPSNLSRNQRKTYQEAYFIL